MKKYLLPVVALLPALAAEARSPRPSRAQLQEQAIDAQAEADSLRRLSDVECVAIDSLQSLL